MTDPLVRFSGRAVGRPSLRSVGDLANTIYPDVRPIELYSFQAEPGMIQNGFPVVPPIWAAATTACSTTGEFLDSDRPTPRDVNVPCHSRFLPGTDLWDDVAGVWRPFYTQGINYYWTSNPSLKPTAQTIDYRVGREIIQRDVMTFTSGDYLSSSFNSGIDDAVDFTVVLVASFENPTGYTALHAGTRDVYIAEDFRVGDNGYFSTVPSLTHPTQVTPAIVVLSVTPPKTTIWVSGPNRKIVSTSFSRTTNPVSSMVFELGRNGSGTATASMRVLEFALFQYGVQTSAAVDGDLNIYQLISLYASMYGAA